MEQVVKGMGPDGELEMLFGESSSRVHETGILFANFSIAAGAVLDELSEVVHEAMARYGLVYKYNIFPLGDFNLMAAMGLELAGAPETDRFYAEVLWQCWQDLLSAVDRSFGRRVRIRAGMSVGQCLQGPVGDNLLHNEITIIGPDCNLAARLVARAMVRKERHGTLFAAADNYLRVSHLVRPAEPFEHAELKGFHDPVPLYSLRSRTGHESPAQLAERLRRLPLVTGAGEVIHDWSRISLDSQLGACKTDIESFQRKPNAPNRLIAFCGPGGEGKTRRIAEIVHWCSRRNWQVFFSECLSWYQGTRSRTEEGDGRTSKLAVPFHPFVKILRDQLFEVRPGDSPQRAMERIAATFKRLGHGSAAGENAPVVASFLGIEDPRAGAVPEAMTPEERRNVFFETVALLFESAISSSGGRLLVVIDDLQWADPGSVRLLSFLLGRVRGGLLVCTSVRNKEQIAGLIEGEEPDKGGRLVVESQKLAGPGVDMLTRVALGLKPDQKLPKALELRLAELESNPLFILEFCRILTDREVIFVRDGEIQRFDEKAFAGVTVPNRIQSVVEEMVNRLPRRDYDLIRGCSVLGTVLHCRDAAELASLAGRGRSAGPGEVQQMLHGLAGRQVLVIEQDQGQDSVYRFSRALIAQALYQGLTPSLRKRLHGFAAHIWEAAGAERQLEKCLNCAMHYELAEIPDRAAGYYLESGRMEGALFENERAVELLDKVEEFCRSHRIEGDINLLLGVHEFRGGTALALGRYETALEDSKKLGTLAGRLGKQDKVVLSRLAAGRIYLTRGRAGDFKLALARYRVAEEASGGELIQTLEARNGQTRVLLEMGNLEEAIERATSSLSRLGRRRRRRDVREVILEARLLRTHGSSLMRLSRYEEAIAVFDTALALVEKSQDSACQPVQAQILNSKALALGSSFKLQEALDLYYKARSLARKVGDINLQLLILNNMSVALNDSGKNTQALDLLVSNYDTIRRLAPESRALAGFEFNIGECYHFMEDLPRAERHYRRALEITRKIQSRQFGVNVMYNLGEVLRDQGKEEEAFEVLDAAADVARKFGYRQQLLDMENILGEMDLATGRVAEATRRHEDALAVARDLDDTFAIGWSLRNLAEDYLAKGGADKTVKAGTLLAESLDFCRQAGQPENTLVTLACLLKNRDRLVLDAGRCGSLLEELETLAKKINSQKYLELYARYRSELKNGGSRR
ncbi:MAG: tetratricopeptide repeat protein [Candidatus Glassbacteria bacterium]